MLRTANGLLPRPQFVAAVIALALLAAACGGKADAASEDASLDQGRRTGSQGTETASPDADTQALVFAECMRDNGVDMPDPGPGQQGLADAFQAVAGNYDRETLQQAISACQELMPRYASQEQHTDDWMLKLAECLREQGLDVSDDPFNDAHSGAVDVGEFSAAMEVCRDVLIRGGQ
jgi:hypothetical protein